MGNNDIVVSPLAKTWILDIDGTIVKHNGYKIDGKDSFLEGAQAFLLSIPKNDKIVFLTSRTNDAKELTEQFFAENNVRYDEIIYNAPYGERILVNDRKPSGLNMSIAINTNRDKFMTEKFLIDENL